MAVIKLSANKLAKVARQAKSCTRCPLYKIATQTVFGEGPVGARLMLVGEQPGDQEDLAGKPFVGPAGKLLDRALEEAGIDRSAAYLTNVVKHFKWEGRGKRRIHAKPSWSEMTACRPWLEAEIAVIEPRVLVCLGATAAQALLGRDFRVSRQRGELVESPLAPYVTVTLASAAARLPAAASRPSTIVFGWCDPLPQLLATRTTPRPTSRTARRPPIIRVPI